MRLCPPRLEQGEVALFDMRPTELLLEMGMLPSAFRQIVPIACYLWRIQDGGGGGVPSGSKSIEVNMLTSQKLTEIERFFREKP